MAVCSCTDKSILEDSNRSFNSKMNLHFARKQLTAVRQKTSSCSKAITHINFVLAVSSSYQLYHTFSTTAPSLATLVSAIFVSAQLSCFPFARITRTLRSFAYSAPAFSSSSPGVGTSRSICSYKWMKYFSSGHFFFVIFVLLNLLFYAIWSVGLLSKSERVTQKLKTRRKTRRKT